MTKLQEIYKELDAYYTTQAAGEAQDLIFDALHALENAIAAEALFCPAEHARLERERDYLTAREV